MKMFNTIEAEKDGEIVEIPIDNGQIVEFGQVLVRIREEA
ncbi:MAG: biotin/lipoyl-containing protein [Anaerotignum sp.]